MEKTLTVLNELERKGYFIKYAIGGGIALMFYAEPALTYDVDIFISLHEHTSQLTDLSPIYTYMKKKGYKTEKEHIIIEGIPVQFIPVYNRLVAEAVESSVELKFKRTKTRVIKVEHLIAILLQTYRPKDKERIIILLEQAKIDMRYLRRVLKSHGLLEKFQSFKKGSYE